MPPGHPLGVLGLERHVLLGPFGMPCRRLGVAQVDQLGDPARPPRQLPLEVCGAPHQVVQDVQAHRDQ
ncbi:hypothetical protein STENM327S_08096 [Streptomyces tendae]